MIRSQNQTTQAKKMQIVQKTSKNDQSNVAPFVAATAVGQYRGRPAMQDAKASIVRRARGVRIGRTG